MLINRVYTGGVGYMLECFAVLLSFTNFQMRLQFVSYLIFSHNKEKALNTETRATE